MDKHIFIQKIMFFKASLNTLEYSLIPLYYLPNKPTQWGYNAESGSTVWCIQVGPLWKWTLFYSLYLINRWSYHNVKKPRKRLVHQAMHPCLFTKQFLFAAFCKKKTTVICCCCNFFFIIAKMLQSQILSPSISSILSL